MIFWGLGGQGEVTTASFSHVDVGEGGKEEWGGGGGAHVHMFTQRNHYKNVSESMSRTIFVIQQLWLVVFFNPSALRK